MFTSYIANKNYFKFWAFFAEYFVNFTTTVRKTMELRKTMATGNLYL